MEKIGGGIMKKEEYISISEFANRAGVSKAYIYKALKDRLQPYCKEVDNQKRLNIKALELFDSTKLSTISTKESTDKDTLKELIEILQEQQETLKKELAVKNKQIEDYADRLKESHILIGRQQELQALEQKEAPAEVEKPCKNLLNHEKISSNAEYSRLLERLLPRIGLFSTRADREELERILELMSEEEREIVSQKKPIKEAIDHIRKVDFDKLEREMEELKKQYQAK